MSKPQIIEELSAETILARKREALQRLFAQNGLPYNAGETGYDPATILLEASAYDELLLRARVNDAARANILAFAAGGNLDALGDFHGVARLAGEEDEAYRRRIRLFAASGRGGGTADYYRYHALSADSAVKDAIVYRQGKSPVIYIAIFADNDSGAADQPLLDKVALSVNSASVRMVSDTLQIISAVRIFARVKAQIWLYQTAEPQADRQAAANLLARWQQRQGLGRPLTQSFIISSLMTEDIARVHLIEPKGDIEAAPNEAIAISEITLEPAGIEL